MLAFAFCLALQSAQDFYRSGVEKHERGDHKGAREDLSKAIEAKPDFADAYTRRGSVLLDQEEHRAAIADLSKAIELAPKSGDPYSLRARARYRLWDFAGAETDLTQAFDRGVKSESGLLLRGSARSRQGKHAQSVEDFSEVLRRNPREAWAYFGRGVSRYHLGEVRHALVDFTDAIDLDPKLGFFYFFRGWSYAGIQSWENALRDFRRAIEVTEPGYPSLERRAAIWFASVHLGEAETARRELAHAYKEAPSGQRAGASGLVTAYLLGELPEEDFADKLKSKGEPSRAAFWIAARRAATGDATVAAPFWEKAASHSGTEGPAARLLLQARHGAERRKAVEALEAKARKLKSFHAEFEVHCPSHAEEDNNEFDAGALIVDGDIESRRFLLRLTGTKGAVHKTAHFLLEGNALTVWGFEAQAYRMILGDFFTHIDGMYDALFRDLDRIVPPERKSDPTEASPGFSLLLDLEPKPSKEERGVLRAAVMWARHPFSWLGASAREGPAPVREGPLVTFDFPRQKKKISVDEETGFLAGLEVTDYDGKVRRLARRRFAASAEFPDLVVPAKPVTKPVPFEQFQRYLQERHSSFGVRLAAVFDRWDRIAEEGKQEDAKRLATSWAVCALDAWHTQLMRNAARQYLKWKLDNGTALEDLLKAADEEVRSFHTYVQTHEKTLRGYLADALTSLRSQARTDLIGLPIDNRRHGALKTFLDEALEFERVEKERSKGDAEKIDKVYREELEAARRL